MQSIMQRHFLSKAPLLMCFWDVRKAFPTTWRERLTVRLWQRGIRGRLLHYILNSGAMRYKRFVDVPGSTERVYFTDERGISTGHVLSPLLFLIEQDDMGAYLADDEHPGVGVDMGMASGCKMAANFFADDGVGFASCASKGPDAVRTALTGMHRLLQRIEVYCDDARRELNVKNKATVIMTMNIHDAVLKSAGFMLCGQKVEIVDEFKYLGTMITGSMRRPTAELVSLSGRVWGISHCAAHYAACQVCDPRQPRACQRRADPHEHPITRPTCDSDPHVIDQGRVVPRAQQALWF